MIGFVIVIFLGFQSFSRGTELVLDSECKHFLKQCQKQFDCQVRLSSVDLVCNAPDLNKHGERIPDSFCTEKCRSAIEKLNQYENGAKLLDSLVFSGQHCFKAGKRMEHCYVAVKKDADVELRECRKLIRPVYQLCAKALIALDDAVFCTPPCEKVIELIRGLDNHDKNIMEKCIYTAVGLQQEDVRVEEIEERYRTRCDNRHRIANLFYTDTNRVSVQDPPEVSLLLLNSAAKAFPTCAALLFFLLI